MTTEEMHSRLRSLGLTKTYKPVFDRETESIGLTTRQPVSFVDGHYVGSEITIAPGSDTFNVWTDKMVRAKRLAKEYGLKVRIWNGEADLMVPGSLADMILPQFGARMKKQYSQDALANLRKGIKKAQEAVKL